MPNQKLSSIFALWFEEKENPLHELIHGSANGLTEGKSCTAPLTVFRLGKQHYKNLHFQLWRMYCHFCTVLLSLGSKLWGRMHSACTTLRKWHTWWTRHFRRPHTLGDVLSWKLIKYKSREMQRKQIYCMYWCSYKTQLRGRKRGV